MAGIRNAATTNKVDDAQLLATLIYRSRVPPDNPAGMIDETARLMSQSIRDYAGDLDAWYGATFGQRADGTGPAGLFRRSGIASYQPNLPTSDKQAEAKRIAKIESDIAVDIARRSAKATAHVNDPWVTFTGGGFGEAYGTAPPANVVRAGGQPLTQSAFQNLWGATYERVFQEFAGRMATPQEQADIIGRGMSVYALKDQLSKSTNFKASPVWKQSAAGLVARAESILGQRPSDEFIRRAFAEGWDEATFDANVRKLPAYQKGPEYKAGFAAGREVYRTVFGQPDRAGNQWIKNAVMQGWTQDQMAAALRAQPEYKYSPEMQAKTVSFLDQLGLLIGARPVLEDAGEDLPATGNVLAQFRDQTDGKPDPLNPGLPRMKATLTPPAKKKAS